MLKIFSIYSERPLPQWSKKYIAETNGRADVFLYINFTSSIISLSVTNDILAIDARYKNLLSVEPGQYTENTGCDTNFGYINKFTIYSVILVPLEISQASLHKDTLYMDAIIPITWTCIGI